MTNTPCPFTIFVDGQEKHPWTFEQIRVKRNDPAGPVYQVEARRAHLGAGMGDYTIHAFGESFGHSFAIERKSLEDCHGTLLGWKQRRDRFQRELDNLASMDAAAVVVEAPLGYVLATAPQWGKKSAAENAVALHSTILSWSQQYRVPWYFCDDRRLAELTAFRLMFSFYQRVRRRIRASQAEGDLQWYVSADKE